MMKNTVTELKIMTIKKLAILMLLPIKWVNSKMGPYATCVVLMKKKMKENGEELPKRCVTILVI